MFRYMKTQTVILIATTITAVATIICAAVPTYILYRTLKPTFICKFLCVENGYTLIQLDMHSATYYTEVKKIISEVPIWRIAQLSNDVFILDVPFSIPRKELTCLFPLIPFPQAGEPVKLRLWLASEHVFTGRTFYVASFNRVTKSLKLRIRESTINDDAIR